MCAHDVTFFKSIVVPYELYVLYDWGKVPELYGTL